MLKEPVLAPVLPCLKLKAAIIEIMEKEGFLYTGFRYRGDDTGYWVEHSFTDASSDVRLFSELWSKF